VPTTTEGIVEAVMESGVGATTMVTVADAVWVGTLLSLTVAVKIAVPLAAGVPESEPVDERIRPAGRLPEEMVHL
jgi:hypothetical protein